MPTIMSRVLAAAFIAGAFLLPTGVSAQGFKVIANNEVSAAELPTSAVSNLFLKKVSKYPGGGEATPLDLPASSPVRESFSKAVHGRSTSAVVTYWQQQVFSGKDTPPPSKATDDAVVAFVKSTPGAIGYVSEGASVDGVKVVKLK